MNDKSPIFILIVLFVLIGLFYSPGKRIADQNRSQRLIEKNSDSSLNQKNTANLDYSQNKVIGEEIKDIEENIEKLNKNLEKKISENKKSPYADKIDISSVSGFYNNDPNKEYIYIYTNLEKTEIIKITGWYLKSELTGYYATIGKAALLPFPFSKTESDIVLGQGDRVILTKGFSPIGISFRTNKCTGYFEENREFTPNLELRCPLPRDEELPRFSSIHDRNEECLDIIERVPRCTTKNNSFIRDLPDTVTSSCKTYLTTQINYNSCVAKHFDDTDFPGNEYRVYLNKFGPLWRERSDKINLYDENGLIVDSISY